MTPAVGGPVHVDDLGHPVPLPAPPARVVSLVPSLTESLAATAPGLVVGATDWCSHPAGLDVRRVRGTKNPDLAAVLALAPDLVVADQEENREVDVAALRAAGVPVWVTRMRDVPGALGSLRRLLAACGLDGPVWLREAAAAWAAPAPGVRRRAFVPVWRRPWMAVGGATFAADVLRRLGLDPVCGTPAPPGRYPRVDLDAVRADAPDVVVLPDEPYAFTAAEGREVFGPWGVPVVRVSGRLLTWYGPSLVPARAALAAALGG